MKQLKNFLKENKIFSFFIHKNLYLDENFTLKRPSLF